MCTELPLLAYQLPAGEPKTGFLKLAPYQERDHPDQVERWLQ